MTDYSKVPHGLPGKLIVFEGIDGCGKQTQIELLCRRLDSEGIDYVLSKTPGGTPLGDKIRDILFHSVTTHNLVPDAASLLYLASHLQSYEQVVKPALEAGKIVISDRWDAFSGLAFGIYGGAHPVSREVLDLRRKISGPCPDIVILLAGNVELLHERANARTTETHEQGKVWNSPETLSRIQNVYVELSCEYKNVFEMIVVNNMSPEMVAASVWRVAARFAYSSV